MWQWIRTSLRVLDRSLLTGAWLFIICTIGQLSWAFWSLLPGGETTTKFISTTTDGVEHNAIGLTYSGWFGIGLARAEFIFVVLATVLSVFATGMWRRIGHVALIAWAGLYTGNMIWLTSLSPMWMMLIISGMTCLFFICTVYRAVRCWNKRPSVAGAHAGQMSSVPAQAQTANACPSAV
jgi:hypothetical protein